MGKVKPDNLGVPTRTKADGIADGGEEGEKGEEDSKDIDDGEEGEEGEEGEGRDNDDDEDEMDVLPPEILPGERGSWARTDGGTGEPRF